MVTTAQGPEAPTTTREELAERAAMLRDEASRAARTLLTGQESGRARRNLLFAATAGFIVVGLPLAALLPLMLLALTDTVVLDD